MQAPEGTHILRDHLPLAYLTGPVIARSFIPGLRPFAACLECAAWPSLPGTLICYLVYPYLTLFATKLDQYMELVFLCQPLL